MHRTRNAITVANQTADRKSNFLLACFALAVLFASIVTQPAHAAAVAKRYAYVADPAGKQVLAYSIAPNGALVGLVGVCFATPAGAAPIDVMVDPTGRFLYVADQGASVMLEFPINPVTGCLGAPFPPVPTLGIGPFSIGITAEDTYLYVSDANGFIDGFSINPVNGTLVSLPAPNPFPAGPNPTGLVVDSFGSCVYVANDVAAGTITGFTFNAAGLLAPAGVTGTGPAPFGLALDVVGQFLFVTNSGANTLESFPIIPGGGCALAGPNPLVPTGPIPMGVAVTSFGQVAFTADNGAAFASGFLVNPATGAPAVNGGKPTGAKPIGATIDQTGKFLYITNNGAGSVSGYTISPINGTLAPIPGSPWAAGAAPFAIATQP
jgi:6-phosphogluconolactonase